MRLDTVTAEIRPRSDWEAVDLGFAMVRRSFWRCITVWWMVLGLPLVIGGFLLWDHPLILVTLFWWFKPVGSRMVLFELSRRLFGEEPSWKSVWRELPRAWYRRFAYRFLWARFSPWLPVTLAVEDLEGLRGKIYKQRSSQIVRKGEGAVMWLYLISDLTAAWIGLAILATLLMFVPEGQDGAWKQAVESWDSNYPYEIPLLITRTVVGCTMIAMSLTDLFVIGAGFGIYINNRTWIEGWDVELAFRRLAQRLGKVAIIALSFLMVGVSARAEEEKPPAQVIREVKEDPAFKVHTVTDRVPKEKSTSSSKPHSPPSSGGGFAGFGQMLVYTFAVCAIVLLLGLAAWIIWTYRHIFGMKSGAGLEKKAAPTARVVMGMEVAPDTLPPDVPTAAWILWQQGRHQEALGLLYRGSISKVMEVGRVEIQESDTEGDCVRRVEAIGSAAYPEYFRGITKLWVTLAYAGISPADSEVQALCSQWPFGKGGRS